MDRIKHHPLILAELVEPFDFFSEERMTLLHHHEHFDGSGYPYGLKGKQIPIGARLLAVADALVAMLSERPHRKKLSEKDAVGELVKNAGTQFDPAIIACFLEAIQASELIKIPPEVIKDLESQLPREQSACPQDVEMAKS
jgi:HD-GYP domain-containing protein (c-di-GMP phosphodiesterase class II)